jgi:hypothetical protein
VRRKGVLYDVGRVLTGNWRPDYHPDLVRRELAIIAGDLHCTAVKICGRDIGRLVVAGDAGAELGLEVWLCPELWDKSPEATSAYIQAAAGAAEQLRRRWPEQVVLSVGTELSLFMRGVLPGRTFARRVRHLVEQPSTARQETPLREYLTQTAATVRRAFDGPITYAALPFERVDWDQFDIVGVDLYWHQRIADRYGQTLQRWLDLGKPVVISEFGFRTRTGADQTGAAGPENFNGLSMLAHAIPVVGRRIQPRVKTIHERNEAVQASSLVRQLEIIDQAGVDGAFVHTFTFPLMPYDENPRHDLDTDSFALVKALSRGRHGTAYPDMAWEPKLSFTAVADYYATH